MVEIDVPLLREVPDGDSANLDGDADRARDRVAVTQQVTGRSGPDYPAAEEADT
jgi:hypothetical protein